MPIDTLQKLMDHRTTATTQIYYRVTWARKREAIERLAPLTMDHRRPPGRISRPRWSSPSGCARRSAGSRSRSGYCTEQHNVRALGAHCPFSHQCLGCEHFRTDPSHLPDLYAYLERLLETRERLRVAVPQLAEWARTKAIPADAEIRTVRTLIRAGEDALNELAPARASQAARAVPRAARDASTDGRRDRDRRDRRHAQPRTDVHAARVHAAALGARSAGQDQRGMTDREASMRTAKRPINSEKYERVIAVIAQIKDQGRDDQLKATVIARRAGVHRSFVSNHFAGQIAHAQSGDPVAIHRRADRPNGAERRLAAGSRWKQPSTRPAKRKARSAP